MVVGTSAGGNEPDQSKIAESDIVQSRYNIQKKRKILGHKFQELRNIEISLLSALSAFSGIPGND